MSQDSHPISISVHIQPPTIPVAIIIIGSAVRKTENQFGFGFQKTEPNGRKILKPSGQFSKISAVLSKTGKMTKIYHDALNYGDNGLQSGRIRTC